MFLARRKTVCEAGQNAPERLRGLPVGFYVLLCAVYSVLLPKDSRSPKPIFNMLVRIVAA